MPGREPITCDDFSEWFWDIIARADKDRKKLTFVLHTLINDELYRFALEFRCATNSLLQGPQASYLHLSEDGDADLSDWIVSRGKQVYCYITMYPEGIKNFDESESESFGFGGVAEDILVERLGYEALDELSNDFEQFVYSDCKRVADYWIIRQQGSLQQAH